MKINIGKKDKIIRVGVGILIAAAGIYFDSLWGLVSFIPLITAFTGVCPLYKVAGMDTISNG